ncbi:HlyD family efflux transporter periplasmic adaptor subunit [Neglectibacter timonensis]|uniref:HlyD family efflux transporter periplasmic adaptor subunit n=1 Tax=Neglectibacter timonensis TaxID=1776382 RepID=UPI00248F1D82|nr:HlyD family efflux transporter periplasmic adaptor subunit [Neglectibacter timonensis]
MNSKKIRKFAAMAIAILVLIYVGYQVYTIRHKEITTETAMYASVSDTLQTKGFAVRKESVIHEAYSGILSYHVADGVRVSKGEAIADIYASESDAAAQNQLASIDREIENLSLLTGPSDYYASNPSVIGTQIYTALGEILVEARQNDFSKIASLKEELQTALNRKQLLTGDESGEDYEQRIAALQSQRDSLVASAGDKVDVISADTAGYFVSSLDGFENAVDIDQVKKLTVTKSR